MKSYAYTKNINQLYEPLSLKQIKKNFYELLGWI